MTLLKAHEVTSCSLALVAMLEINQTARGMVKRERLAMARHAQLPY